MNAMLWVLYAYLSDDRVVRNWVHNSMFILIGESMLIGFTLMLGAILGYSDAAVVILASLTLVGLIIVVPAAFIALRGTTTLLRHGVRPDCVMSFRKIVYGNQFPGSLVPGPEDHPPDTTHTHLPALTCGQ